MGTYTVKKGDCAWNFAKRSLNKMNPSNVEIAKELNHLISVYNCKDADEFNKKYFRIGFSFEEKNNITTDLNAAKNDTVGITKKDTIFSQQTNKRMLANFDTLTIKAESIKVESLRVEKIQVNNTIKSKQYKGYDKFADLTKEQDRINNLSSDKNKVIEWNKKFNKNNKDNYVIVDKKSCMAYVYSPDGKVVKQYEIGAAENKSDALLKRSKKHPERDFKSSSAGIYTANYRATGKDAYAKLYNNRVLQLSNDDLRDKGIGTGETGVALHQVPNGNEERIRKLKQPGVSDKNNRFSDGCINFLPEDFDDCMKHVKGVGTKVYILPEDSNNYMMVKNGKLHLAQKKYTGDVATSNTKKDPVKNIKLNVKNTKIRNEGKEMAAALANNKQALIKDLKIDNDTYNELAHLSLGIAGQETNYGSPWAGLRNGKPYCLKENYTGLVNFTKSLKGNNSYNSRGMTQIKLQGYTDENVRSLLKKYNITEDNLKDPNKCAIATMIVLSSIYRNELPSLKNQMQKLNISKSDAILYCWSNHKNEIKKGTATPDKNIYVKNVHKYMNDFELYQKA